MTTVVCVLVKGHVDEFRPEHVIKLAGMVKRWMDRPYRFICLTDHPRLPVRHMDVIQIPSPPALLRRMPYGYPAGNCAFAWWSKLEAFSPGRFAGRVLYLDLDTLVVAPLTPILDYPAPFALVPHAGTFNGRLGMRVVKRFNSSVMVWDAGVNEQLYTQWDLSVAHRLHGDQDWIGEQMPDAATMPAGWFPRISELKNDGPTPESKVVLVKSPKNTLAAATYPWVSKVWV